MTATFAINTYTLTYTAGANGTITGTSPQTVDSRRIGTLVTAVPNTGYHFVSWSDGVLTAARTDTNVTADITVTANFAITTYTLTYTAGANGTITGASPQTVDPRRLGHPVTAVPNTGYHFVSWSDGVLTAARTDTNVTADITVTANFAIKTYTLTYTAGANGTITGTTPQTVDHGGSGTEVTAVPNVGYHFVSWSDGVLTAARTDTNVTSDITVTADFAINSYTLTYTAGEPTARSPGPRRRRSSTAGRARRSRPFPNVGYHFVSWSDGVLTASRTDTNVTADLSVTATFSITTFTLTYTAGANGTISGISPQTIIHGGSGTEVTAVPNTGYHFVSWSDGVLTAARTDINVTADITVTASFALNAYTLTIISDHGTIEKAPDLPAYDHGASVVVTSTAATGYTFINWTGDVTSTDNPLTLTMDGDKSLTANYSLNTYTISGTVNLEAAGLAGVTMAGLPGNPVTDGAGFYQAVVNHGTSLTVTPTHVDYTFAPASRTYTGITADHINQDYAATPVVVPTITVTSPNGGERWSVGSTHDITWTQTGLIGTVTIDLYKGGVYQKTLGTPEAAAGTFDWSILSTEVAGTDYTIRAWQSGGVSDDSDADFAVVRAVRVDFNGDGQEDLLWRYYGEGGYNRVWFLGSAEEAGQPLTLASAAPQSAATRTQAMKTGIADPRDIGIVSGRLQKLSPAEAGTLMGSKEDRARALVNDPRHVAKPTANTSVVAAPAGISDPRSLSSSVAMTAAVDPIASAAVLKTWLGGADVMPVNDMNWHIVGTGDFNNDTHVDILWRNISTGSNVVWFMNGTDWLASAELLPVADQNWQIVGTGDFDNDTHVDILWRNSTDGSNVVWYMEGAIWEDSAVLLGVSDQNWQIVGTGDFNRDGNVDLLWRYNGAGGANVVWYMDDATWTGSAELIPVGDTAWQIIGHR